MAKQAKRPNEDQDQEGHPLGLSRRDFFRGMGTGAIATSVAAFPSIAETAPPAAVRDAHIQLTVNETTHRLTVRAHWTLLDVLRRELGLTGTKKSCDRGSCGSCTVIMDGKSVYACSRLAIEADRKKILTIEGLLQGGKLHPIQEAFLEEDGMQCGFCTSGQIMSVKALLEMNPRPSQEEIKEGLAGNTCRCSAYPKILKSAMAAARKG